MRILKNIKDAIQGKAAIGSVRSSGWSRVRATHLKSNPACAVCSGMASLEVHHIKPFHEYPHLELNPANLITLCESKANGINCHLLVGHLGNYKSSNPVVKKDAQTWNKKLKNRKV